MADIETETNEGLSSQERASLVAQMASAYFGANAVAPENIQSVVGLLATSLDAAITPPAPVAVEPTVTKPVFDKEIRRLAPHWFATNNVDNNKEKLLEMARNGEQRPHKRSDELGKALSKYTTKNANSYDPVFDKEIRRLAPPHWF